MCVRLITVGHHMKISIFLFAAIFVIHWSQPTLAESDVITIKKPKAAKQYKQVNRVTNQVVPDVDLQDETYRNAELTCEDATSWDYGSTIGENCYKPGPDGVLVGQMGGNYCMAQALAIADSEMNSRYKELFSVLFEDKMLRDGQRAWLKFRDLECALRTSGMGEGSATQYVINSCHLDLTLKRIRDFKLLEAGIDCIGCPVSK